MKKHRLPFIISAFTALTLAACNILGPKKNDNTPSGGGDNTPSGGEVQPSGKYRIADPDTSFVQRNSKEEVIYDDLFNLNNKVEITIDVDNSEMQKINDDNVYGGDYDSIKPETYHLAKKFTLKLTNGSKVFTWELENVGIRQKGNTSRKPIFKDNGELNNRNHFKISFDETFSDKEMYDDAFIAAHKNKEYKDREFLGLSGLDIKWNKVDDSTHIKEMYSNLMLRSSGIAAQRIGLGMMKMNYDGGKTADFGLCTIHEQTSKSFIKRAMGENTKYINMPTWADENAGTHGLEDKKYGDLYKASYGKGDGASSGPDFTTDSITGKRLGVKTDIKGYNWPTYERKTNTSDEYNDQQMKDLVALLNKSSTTYAQIEEKVDLEWLAMEEAIMYFLGNPDAMKYNYNNYQVYFRRTDGKMIVLPIDNDRCFGVGNGWKSGADYMISDGCKPDTGKALNDRNQRNPLLTKTIFASGSNQSKTNYNKCIELVKNSKWVKNETFESFYNIAKKTYSGLADFSLNGGSDNISFSSYMQKKLALAGGSSLPDEGGQGEGGETQPTSIFNKDMNYYLVGTFNNWGNKGQAEDYKLHKYTDPISDIEYLICNFEVKELDADSEFKLKICGGSFNNWQEEFGFDKTDEGGVNYMKKGTNLPSVKYTDGDLVGKIVRFYITVEYGNYFFVPLTHEQTLMSLRGFMKVAPAITVNDSDVPVVCTNPSDDTYTAKIGKELFGEGNKIKLRFLVDIEGIVPYYFNVVEKEDHSLTLRFDGMAHQGTPAEIVVEENADFVNVTVNTFTGVVTCEAGHN